MKQLNAEDIIINIDGKNFNLKYVLRVLSNGLFDMKTRLEKLEKDKEDDEFDEDKDIREKDSYK